MLYCEPNKRGGKPCLRGLRIKVYEVLEYLASDLMIVSKDSDMHDLSLVFGSPPKVIWLRLGNFSTLQVENLLRREFK